MKAERRLLITHRQISEDVAEAYHRAWQNLRGASEAATVHAWRYRSASDGTRFVEFLEFSPADDPRLSDNVAAALTGLDSLVSGTAGEWLDVTQPPSEQSHT